MNPFNIGLNRFSGWLPLSQVKILYYSSPWFLNKTNDPNKTSEPDSYNITLDKMLDFPYGQDKPSEFFQL